MNGGKKPANTGSGSPVLQGGEDVTCTYVESSSGWTGTSCTNPELVEVD